MAVAAAAGSLYHPRPPDSPLRKLLDDPYDASRSHYPSIFENRYGFLRPVVDEVV